MDRDHLIPCFYGRKPFFFYLDADTHIFYSRRKGRVSPDHCADRLNGYVSKALSIRIFKAKNARGIARGLDNMRPVLTKLDGYVGTDIVHEVPPFARSYDNSVVVLAKMADELFSGAVTERDNKVAKGFHRRCCPNSGLRILRNRAQDHGNRKTATSGVRMRTANRLRSTP
jgi:asparagine synthetase B (glutamine-hydrolysing)